MAREMAAGGPAVCAEAGTLNINPGTWSAKTFDDPVCSTVHGSDLLASQYSADTMAAAGVASRSIAAWPTPRRGLSASP